MRTLLVDADIVAYQSAFACQSRIVWDEETTTVTADLKEAQDKFKEILDEAQALAKSDVMTLCFSDSSNWRNDIYPPYKANRKAENKPVLLRELRAWADAEWDTYTRPTLEADDILGILGTGTKVKGDKVIWSIDKDLLQIPGKHIHRGQKCVVTDVAGDYAHFLQTLTGDSVDNYPGCPGIGPVKAAPILQVKVDPLDQGEDVVPQIRLLQWQAIVAAYEQKGLTAYDALTQARIARILRAADYDFAARTVILWNPPT